MSLTHRIKRRFGYDTIHEHTHTIPIYQYRIAHINGDVSEVVGHGYNIDGAFARFYEYSKAGVMPGMFDGYSVWASGQNVKRTLESIKEIEQEQVGETTFSARVDYADGTVQDRSIESTTL